VYGRGRSALNLGEAEIRYAMDNTKSNAEAARFLKVSFTTYKKYAKMYTDSESGKTLYDMHTNQAGYGITKNVSNANIGKYSIEKILAGEHPTYPTWKLRNRILALAILERRITDDTVPLLLDHIDGDTTNHRIENIQMLCLNCYYQQTGNPFKQDKETYWNYNRLE
jgi:hypothetical protein